MIYGYKGYKATTAIIVIFGIMTALALMSITAMTPVIMDAFFDRSTASTRSLVVDHNKPEMFTSCILVGCVLGHDMIAIQLNTTVVSDPIWTDLIKTLVVTFSF